MKVVSLSVHRNTQKKRRQREVSKELVVNAKLTAQRKDVDGFVIVAWTGIDADVSWSATEAINCSVMPEFVKGAIQRKVSMLDSDK